jgi:hypothetical protein
MSSGSLQLITKLTVIAVVGSVNLQRIPHSAHLLNVVFRKFQPSTNRFRANKTFSPLPGWGAGRLQFGGRYLVISSGCPDIPGWLE